MVFALDRTRDFRRKTANGAGSRLRNSSRCAGSQRGSTPQEWRWWRRWRASTSSPRSRRRAAATRSRRPAATCGTRRPTPPAPTASSPSDPDGTRTSSRGRTPVDFFESAEPGAAGRARAATGRRRRRFARGSQPAPPRAKAARSLLGRRSAGLGGACGGEVGRARGRGLPPPPTRQPHRRGAHSPGPFYRRPCEGRFYRQGHASAAPARHTHTALAYQPPVRVRSWAVPRW